MTDLQLIESELAILEPQIKEARSQENKDWDLINELLDRRQVLEEDRDAILRIEQYERELQEIADFWDDEKNRDAYTMSIIDLEFSDVTEVAS